MAIWLQIILAIVLVGVGACLVPLLLQLRRTAASVQILADSAREDLRQISADVHHLRDKADGLVELAEASLAMPLGIGRIVSGAAQALEAVLGQGGPWMAALLTGIKFALNLIRRPKKEAAAKEGSHE
jgi:hypothetical protein